MKKYPLLAVLLACLFAGSCKKLIEEKEKNAFLEVMTNGYWHVESYNEGTVSITPQFSGYKFKFEQDGTVACLKDDLDIKGTWLGDIDNYTISSNFPGVEDPLKKLNGTWKITNTKLDFVNAEMTTDQGKMVLQLKKY